tara:strand:+ start:1339 stop:1638 length:300 start_codon:yes stop_codon:yes gene_type:complete
MDASRNMIDVLEQKLIVLLNKLKEQHLAISQLEGHNTELKRKYQIISAQIKTLKEENKSLKIANNLLGSNEGKSITKNKLNRLIKEVDTCIDQLSEIIE